MVTIQDTELKRGIQQAIERTGRLLAPVLVCEVQRIDALEPLAFFAAGKERYLGERFFWKDPTNSTFLTGLGICKQIQSDHNTNRFIHVEQEWKRFMENGVILDEIKSKGTGPIMFGGFSFDPLKEKTNLWSKFSDSLFHVPKFLMSKIDGQTYLTTNVVITQHDDLSIVDKILNERQMLLSSIDKAMKSQNVTIVDAVEISSKEWKNTVRELVQELKNSELKKVVMARELRITFKDTVPIETVLLQLLKEQPRSFTFAFESNGDCFIGASPERLVKKDGRNMYSTCLAGSIARGKNEEEDQQLGEALLHDEKNLIEHQYVVDMIKGAMEEVCSEVNLPACPTLMKIRDIQHLYTPVEGLAKDSSSLLHVVGLLHPTPALGGLPQRKAVEKIREIEHLDRGFYGAPIGWLDYEGNGDFAVGLRSGLVQGSEASLFAGCGIVKDSDVESEYIETKIKFRPMLSALGGMKK